MFTKFGDKFVVALENFQLYTPSVPTSSSIIPSQMEVAPLHCTVDITQKRSLSKNTKEIENM